jgi:hypothetical protein
MPSEGAFVEHLGINSDSVIAESHAKLLRVIPNLDFNLVGTRMAESVSQNLPANPIELVLKSLSYVARRSFYGYTESTGV